MTTDSMEIPYEMRILHKLESEIPSTDQQIDIEFSLTPYQLFIKYQIHPLSHKYRFLVKHGTGLGKSVGGLLAAKNFLDKGLRVFIVTFNKQIFIDDMFKFPILGFIGEQEKQFLTMHSPETEQFKSVFRQVYKRIMDKITFYGYRELYNMMFWVNEQTQDIKANVNLLKELQNSIMIFDEIHNAYNREDNNTWGKTIQFISYIMGSSIHMLYMSATPLNNPEEIVELLSLMYVEQEQKQLKQDITVMKDVSNLSKTRLTSEQMIELGIGKLHLTKFKEDQSIYDNIRLVMKDRVSFVPELQIDVPSHMFIGDEYKSIKYIKLECCELSSYFDQYQQECENYLQDEEWRKHICFNFPDTSMKLQKAIQLLKLKDPKMQKWAQTIGLIIDSYQQQDILIGDYLKYENINNYSPKYFKLLDEILRVQGKSFVYINHVKNTGVSMIRSLFRTNGLAEHNETPNQDTICYICRRAQKHHYDKTGDFHQYIPYRFMLITGKQGTECIKTLQTFNSISNVEGKLIQIVIGSKRIKEGFNILGVNNAFILSLPFNIPNLIQVLGRPIRKKSHMYLPQEQRYVNVHILVNGYSQCKDYSSDQLMDLHTKGTASEMYGKISKEQLEYFIKMQGYQRIQEYEKIMHENAADSSLYANQYFISTPVNNMRQQLQLESDLKMLPYETGIMPKEFPEIENLEPNSMSTFYYLDISKDINFTIKQLLNNYFKIQHIWPVEELVSNIQQSDFTPNLTLVPVGDIYLQIINFPNVYLVSDFVCYSERPIDINTFTSPHSYKPVHSAIEIQKSQVFVDLVLGDEQQIKLTSVDMVQLYQYMCQQFPIYIETIYRGYTTTPNILYKLSEQQLIYIMDSLTKVLQNVTIMQLNDLLQESFVQWYSISQRTPLYKCEVHINTTQTDCKQCAQYLKQTTKLSDDFKLLVILFLMYMPLEQQQLYESTNTTQQNTIIGYIGYDIQNVYQLIDNKLWKRIQFAREKYIGNHLAILSKSALKIVDLQEALKQSKNRTHGLNCISYSSQQVLQICKQFDIESVDNQPKKQTCNYLKTVLLQRELQHRINFTFQRIMFIDFTAQFKI